jgi:hypothetical protein
MVARIHRESRIHRANGICEAGGRAGRAPGREELYGGLLVVLLRYSGVVLLRYSGVVLLRYSGGGGAGVAEASAGADRRRGGVGREATWWEWMRLG